MLIRRDDTTVAVAFDAGSVSAMRTGAHTRTPYDRLGWNALLPELSAMYSALRRRQCDRYVQTRFDTQRREAAQ